MWISEDFCTWMVLCDKRHHVTEWRLINFFYTNSICHHRSGNLGQTKYRMSRETWDSWQPQLKTTLNAHWVMSLLNTAHVTRKAISSKIEQIYNNKWTNTLTCLHYAWNIKKKHTHTQPFNGPFSRTSQVSRYQKGKTNLDFTEARDSEWQWHQLGHMQVCTLLQTDNHTSTPPLCFYRPDALPAAQPTVSKHWRHIKTY